jgi:DUF971 family protein
MALPHPTPVRIDLKRDERLLIEWADGQVSNYPIALLRTMCPCAACRNVRTEAPSSPPPPPAAAAEPKPRRASLTVLPGDFSQPLRAESAQLVGNYALRIEWSDKHASGIYSFDYLRRISP